MNRLDLRQTQTWMMTLLTAPDGLAAGLRQANHEFRVNADEAVARNGGADRLTRLSVYANSYALRLQQCLEADFPALVHLMGEDLFRFFAAAYIRSHPSGSTTLYDLGAGFADFLQQTQAANHDGQDTDLILPIELARLERKRTEVTRAKGLEGREHFDDYPDPMAHVFMPGLTVSTPPCLRLLPLSHPLIDLLKAIDLGEASPPIPAPQTRYVAITRMHYRVSMQYVQAWQFHFLQAAETPSPIHTCAQYAADQAAMDKSAVLEDLLFWLPIATENGMATIYPSRIGFPVSEACSRRSPARRADEA